MKNIFISGFSDEISDSLDKQIEVVKSLGMKHISIRGIDGKNVGDYSFDEFKDTVYPRLQQNGIEVSSIGSPIGKIFVDDEEAFLKQLTVLETLCKVANLLNCKYIRIFSFFIDKSLNYDDFRDVVINKIKQFATVASKYDVILLHENEKDIFGDIARRCKVIFDEVGSPSFKAIFDFANFVQCGDNTLEAYELLKEHILYFHIKDATYSVSYNVLAGTGDGNIPQILEMAINDGYKGFLTLEPHLAMFGSLQSLELEEAKKVVNVEAEITGEQGYEMQYNAINEILKKIGG
ncbi:MAG: sugar phosphate isomerase/epimerase family protein [Oscillospiraceae bacterium]